MQITKNAAKCKLCGDVIESKHRRDMVWCSCGEIAVDGGLDYLKRSAKNPNNLINMSEFEEKNEQDEQKTN